MTSYRMTSLLYALLLAVTFLSVSTANLEAKRMGSEFLGKRNQRIEEVFPGMVWDEDLGSIITKARLLRVALNRVLEDEDEEDTLFAKQKRIGSEFLGKRSSEFMQKRMGSEFLGRRRREADEQP
ncbi:uncharacterized protein LOC135387779 [Ornithodoros turicata]|uniref:uncharacterized protein LOC135387779 n=1 Tax=Ornithodoros turicata TaxID=34597 RepID=UPI0031393547